MSGAAFFRHLDATQLLKHALGLATQHPGGSGLRYLYYDVPCPAAAAHAEEIAHFGERLGAEVAFEAVTHQDLHRELATAPNVDAGYLAYLGERYFPVGASAA